MQAFGLHLATDLPLPGDWGTPKTISDRRLEIVLDSSVPERLADATLEWAAPIDGGRFIVDRGADGTFLFRHETGRHLLSSDFGLLRCAPHDVHNPGWYRVLLDSVLLCIVLLGGREGLHAASVIVGDSAVAIVAQSGGGKSTLVAELMRRGHKLLSDDITFLAPSADGPPLAIPGPPVMTLPEGEDAPTQAQVLMKLPEERWISAAVAHAPAALRTIIQLDRRPRAVTAMRSADNDASVVLLSAMLALPRTLERTLSRLDVASALAARCQILKLTASPSATPTELAGLVERALAA
ncbi:MAG TPA: hypothetical protein VGG41_12570 [Solirubrobacteraceae bacterium]|jgi:hypothetical protein